MANKLSLEKKKIFFCKYWPSACVYIFFFFRAKKTQSDLQYISVCCLLKAFISFTIFIHLKIYVFINQRSIHNQFELKTVI